MKKFVLFAVVLSLFVSLGFSQTNDDEILGLDGLEMEDTQSAAGINANDEGKKTDDYKKNEIYFAVGTPSFAGALLNFMGLAFLMPGDMMLRGKGNTYVETKTDSFIPVSAGYNHFFLNNHLGVGVFGYYENWAYINWLLIQAKITGQYGWRYFKIYHSASAGVLIVPNVEGGVAPIFDITFLGFKLDFKYMNIFIEGSVPTTSFLKLGASIKF